MRGKIRSAVRGTCTCSMYCCSFLGQLWAGPAPGGRRRQARLCAARLLPSASRCLARPRAQPSLPPCGLRRVLVVVDRRCSAQAFWALQTSNVAFVCRRTVCRASICTPYDGGCVYVRRTVENACTLRLSYSARTVDTYVRRSRKERPSIGSQWPSVRRRQGRACGARMLPKRALSQGMATGHYVCPPPQKSAGCLCAATARRAWLAPRFPGAGGQHDNRRETRRWRGAGVRGGDMALESVVGCPSPRHTSRQPQGRQTS